MSVQRSWSTLPSSTLLPSFWKISEKLDTLFSRRKFLPPVRFRFNRTARSLRTVNRIGLRRLGRPIHSISWRDQGSSSMRGLLHEYRFSGRDSNKPLGVNSLTASRSAVRLIPNCSHNAISPGIIEPCGSSPDKDSTSDFTRYLHVQAASRRNWIKW